MVSWDDKGDRGRVSGAPEYLMSLRISEAFWPDLSDVLADVIGS
jgi:hypothetical protein